MSDVTAILLLGVPILLATVLAIVEVIRRPDVGTLRTIVWVVALIVLPVVAVAVYAILRPLRRPRTAAGDVEGSADAERLVEAFEQRQRGELDDAAFDRVIAGLGR